MDIQHDRFTFRTVWLCAQCCRIYLKEFSLSDGFGHQRDCGQTMYNIKAHDGWCDQHFVAVEQCTGMKDKNDKLIFQGDIIDFALGVNRVFAVKWEPLNHEWKLPRRDLQAHIEVIGNIHENPELLTEKDKPNE